MSLKEVFQQQTIKKRYQILSDYLKNNKVGYLNESELIIFRQIFENYYTPDKNDSKFDSKSITHVYIEKNNYGNKCFSIRVNNQWFPTSIIRLSGSNRTEKENLNRALRNGILIQINNFKKNNPLDINKICPITNSKLNYDAQVDHEIPFHILADEWIKKEKRKKISYKYNLEISNYILEEPYLKSWRKFHLQNAKLRWLSKDGNKIAHKSYPNA